MAMDPNIARGIASRARKKGKRPSLADIRSTYRRYVRPKPVKGKMPRGDAPTFPGREGRKPLPSGARTPGPTPFGQRVSQIKRPAAAPNPKMIGQRFTPPKAAPKGVSPAIARAMPDLTKLPGRKRTPPRKPKS